MSVNILVAVVFSAAVPGATQPEARDAHSLCMPTGPAPAGGYVPYSGAVTERGQKVIGGVPAYEWFRGCGPTAAGMVIGYWDGYGWPELIPGDASTQTPVVRQAIASTEHWLEYSQPLDYAPDPILPDLSEPPAGDEHASDCIGDFMKTSWSVEWNYYGWSWFSDVDVALLDYVSYVNATYGTDYAPLSWNEDWADFRWGEFVAEIDANRPMVFLVDTDGDGGTDHFVTAIGYRDINGYNEYACLDTWSTSGVRWEEFRGLGGGIPWGIYGATYFIAPMCEEFPPNDDCAGAIPITGLLDQEVLLDFDNLCATQDGPLPTGCESNDGDLHFDVWYRWTAPTTGLLTVSMCDLATFDGMMAIYDGSTCPPDPSDELACGDDECGVAAGPAETTIMVSQDQEVLIRVGGWYTTGGSSSPRGTGQIRFSFVRGDLPPAPQPGGSTCTTPGDCTEAYAGADCVAGVCYIPKNRYLSIDPTPSLIPVAYQLTLTEAVGYPTAVGRTWWVDAPVCYDCPDGNPVLPPPPTCEGADRFGWVSKLSSTAVTRAWTETPLHLTDCGIVPNAVYEIRASADGGVSFSDPLEIDTAHDPEGEDHDFLHTIF